MLKITRELVKMILGRTQGEWALIRPSMMDKVGNKVAKNEIAMIKVAAPNMALKIIDDAIQAYGGAGVTTDPRLAQAYAGMRTLRLADGPDEVHRLSIARNELKKYL